MKTVIFGANGQTGRLLTQRALAAGRFLADPMGVASYLAGPL